MFDRDRDGILHIRETQSLLRCLGLRPSVEEVLSILVRYSMGEVANISGQISGVQGDL